MFKAKRSLQYHEFMHHGIKSENSNISQKYSLMRKRKLEMDQLRAELITPDGTKRFKGEDSPDVALMDGMTRQEGKDSSTSPESGADVDSLSDRTCYVCGKLCLKPSDLKRHMMCHTGERPFKCDVSSPYTVCFLTDIKCNFSRSSFIQVSFYSRHIQS